MTVRRVMVAGGGGYIGSLLARTLLERGYSVVIVDIGLYGGEPLEELAGHSRCTYLDVDLRNGQALRRAMESVDAVVHLAGLVGEGACALFPRLAVEINLGSALLTARIAREAGAQRFIFFSTTSVYGADGGIVDEQTPPVPISLYAWTKLEAERHLSRMGSESFSPVVFRPATVYGISPRPRLDSVLNTFAALGTLDGRISVFGGSQIRPLVHIRDVIAAVCLALEAPREAVHDRVLNIGCESQTYTIAELALKVAEMMPGVRIERVERADDERSYRVSFQRVRDCLGFKPSFGIADGIEEIRSSLQDGRIRDPRSDRYNNKRALERRQGQIVLDAPWMRELYELLPRGVPPEFMGGAAMGTSASADRVIDARSGAR